MFNPYGVVIGAQTVVASQCMKAMLATAHFYTSLFDPRPDLAMPARSVRLPYAWWW